jgi:hypothetical protein
MFFLAIWFFASVVVIAQIYFVVNKALNVRLDRASKIAVSRATESLLQEIAALKVEVSAPELKADQVIFRPKRKSFSHRKNIH